MIRFTNGAYDVLKPIALIWLPAIATLYTVLAAIWGFGDVEAVVGSISAVDGFLGAALHLSTNPTPQQSSSGGQLVIANTESGGKSMYLVLESEIEDLEKQKQILLTVTPKS